MGRRRFWRRDAQPTDRLAAPVAGDGRTVVVHYHFFKNAGTSLDATLHENFGKGWVQRERMPPARLLTDDVAEIIRDEPNIVVLSSHTAQMPPPVVPGCTIVPIVFVRHPLDRLRSIYEFERRQNADTPGAIMAKKLDLTGYLEWRLSQARGKDATARSFQAQRLAGVGVAVAERRQRALSRIDDLQFVGLVEQYEASIRELQRLLVMYFPGTSLRSVWENASDRQVSLDERLEEFRTAIPSDLHERLLAENADDLAVWDAVVQRYGRAASAPNLDLISTPT